jgi:hypothetical protein
MEEPCAAGCVDSGKLVSGRIRNPNELPSSAVQYGPGGGDGDRVRDFASTTAFAAGLEPGHASQYAPDHGERHGKRTHGVLWELRSH